MNAPLASDENDTLDVDFFVRAAKRVLTFELLRQQLMAQGVDDPILLVSHDRSVEGVVRATLHCARPKEQRLRAQVALLQSLRADTEVMLKHCAGAASAHLDDPDDEMGELAQSALQAMHNLHDAFPDVAKFIDGMQFAQGVLCKIAIDGVSVGTGFLVGDRFVLTCFHTVEPLVDQDTLKALPDSQARLRVVFDELLLDGATDLYSVKANVRRHWLVAASKYDRAELDPSQQPPDDIGKDCLDYALIQLAEPMGNTAPKYRQSVPRSWVDLDDLASDKAIETCMMVALHHPGGAPIKVALGLFDRHSRCQRRIRHLTPMVPGSSGSPCFTSEWKPYAIHNAGYKYLDVASGKRTVRNQGVPLSCIRNELKKQGDLHLKSYQRVLPATTADDTPILAREAIEQKALDILEAQTPTSVMVIEGSAGSGKTFTGQLLRDMVTQRGHVAIVLNGADFAPDTPERFSTRLMEMVGNPGGGTPVPPTAPDARQRARWISRQLSRWANERIDSVLASARTVWLIFDNMDNVRLSQETHDLLVALIADESASSPSGLRFALLGYGGDLASVPPERLWRGGLELCSAAAFTPFVRHVMGELGRPDNLVPKACDVIEKYLGEVGTTSVNEAVSALMVWRAGQRQKWGTVNDD